MTAEEIARRIQIRVADGTGVGDTLITARLELERYCWVSKYLTGSARDEAILQTQEQLREQLMRALYEDQRQELYVALVDLFKVNPFDFEGLQKSRSRLLQAALRQPASSPATAEAS